MIEYQALFEFLIRAFAGIFVILDPIGASTHFVSLTSGTSDEFKKDCAKRACLVALGVLVFFTFGGNALFKYFGITLAALKIAGGILLFTVALSMLNGKRPGTKTSPEEEKEAKSLEDIAIIPMAIPLMAGPGAITTVMVFAGEATSLYKMALLIGCIGLALLISFLVFVNSSLIQRVLRKTGIKILTRVMGLIMSVIAVQFVINGLRDVLPFILQKVS